MTLCSRCSVACLSSPPSRPVWPSMSGATLANQLHPAAGKVEFPEPFVLTVGLPAVSSDDASGDPAFHDRVAQLSGPMERRGGDFFLCARGPAARAVCAPA